MDEIVVFWFRRDLRLHDNTALVEALKSGFSVLPVFIFDNEIVDELDPDDSRIGFIFSNLLRISGQLNLYGSELLVKRGQIEFIWRELIQQYNIKAVFANEDYEPYAIERDSLVRDILESSGIQFILLTDHVIFHPGHILKDDANPYNIYTPYSRRWIKMFYEAAVAVRQIEGLTHRFISLPPSGIGDRASFGFSNPGQVVESYSLDNLMLERYERDRNYPAIRGTSYLGPHLRFGTVSIREVALISSKVSETFLRELAWREFFMQVLFHYPHVVTGSFREKFDRIEWRNSREEFEKWCIGKTGYPLVDAGMRELNSTGYMHNRVRMITAGFLTKHLLIDWRWGEAYFAGRLLDYELSSNNGNWQWAAGTGCDAAPYFRIFNPYEQQKKFDSSFDYIMKWIPEFGTTEYPQPIVNHAEARKRALLVYSDAR